MSKGLDAIQRVVEQEAKVDREPSRLTYLKKGQSIRVRIPEDIVDNLHVYKVVSVFQKILPTLSYAAEGRSERDLYNEAFEIMREDFATAKANGTVASDDKEAYRNSMILQPKPTILFGVIPLADFVQGKKENLYEAGRPLLLETNLGKNNANIDALTAALTKPTNAKKFGSRAFEITCIASNQYSFAALDEDELEPNEKKVFEETAGVSIPDEVFDGSLFESNTEKQLNDLRLIGFDTTRLKGFENGQQETGTTDIPDEDIPF